MVKGIGFPYESIEVETEDGYVLQMDRLPKVTSFNVVYM